jgi:phosphoglycolate phosphatase-like HAD superfamily hydrolase
MAKFMGRLDEHQIGDKATAQQQLRVLDSQHKFLCCFDVDGHLLDNMTAKQVIVFQPHFMDIFGLRDIETFYRLHAEHHNLWGKDRGCDRHEAKAFTLGSLLQDPELARQLPAELADKLKNVKASIDGYIKHIDETGGAYGFDSLLNYQQANPGDTNLTFLVTWSKAVDLTFPFVTIPMSPFQKVRETLQFVSERADVLIVSKTPYTDICNWLEHHDLIQYVTAVSGKEQGGKDEHICLAMGGEFDPKQKAVTKTGDKYQPENVIMGGDGGGDLKAAKKNGAFFYPTPPGQEEDAWAKAIDEVFTPFFEGKYAENEPGKLDAFTAAMLPRGVWEEPGYDHKQAYRQLQPKREQLYAQLEPGGKLAAL